jgi:hypothetical protein
VKALLWQGSGCDSDSWDDTFRSGGVGSIVKHLWLVPNFLLAFGRVVQ